MSEQSEQEQSPLPGDDENPWAGRPLAEAMQDPAFLADIAARADVSVPEVQAALQRAGQFGLLPGRASMYVLDTSGHTLWQDLTPTEQLMATLIARGIEFLLVDSRVHVAMCGSYFLSRGEYEFLKAHKAEVVALLQRAAHAQETPGS
jgi:hypothetical protein